MRIGFIGLGGMGTGMAANLIRAGHEVTVWNRSREKAAQLAGAKIANTPAEAASTGIVHTMLANDDALEAVTFGPEGIRAGLPKGGVHVSQSTISRALSERLAKAHADAGQQYVAAPVFGRPEAAAAAKLLIVVAGAEEAIERCRPALEALGRKVVVVGKDPWMANVFKLAGNFTIASALETIGEAYALLRKSGVDPALFHDVVNGELFQSPVYKGYGGIILEQRFEPAGFAAKLGLKDIRLALAAADTAETPMPLASVLHDAFLELVADGGGSTDWSAIGGLAAKRAGLR
jgi:3-hydroxyisobutyrate dehydrogenase-like beta-hydroxyacid dehydrogenase